MAKDRRQQTEQTNPNASLRTPRELTEILDANGAGIQAFVQSSEAMWQGMASISQEMFRFATARMREGMDLSGSVMQCGDPREAFRIECDYARNATRQYLDETHKLLGIAAELSQRSWAPIEHLTKDTLGRLNKR